MLPAPNNSVNCCAGVTSFGAVAATPPPPDPGVEAGGVTHFPNYVFLPTGEEPVWLEVTYDDAGVRTEQWWYKDNLGVSQMATGNNVGQNTAAPLVQMVGTFHKDYFANGADLTVTAATIIADAIAGGALLFASDGTSQAPTAADLIVRLDADLKPVGGHGDDAGTQVTATTGDATFEDGLITDMDPGGSRSTGQNRSADGYLLAQNFEQIVVKDGSIVTVAVDIATIPA